jgi:hypothetical protein
LPLEPLAFRAVRSGATPAVTGEEARCKPRDRDALS